MQDLGGGLKLLRCRVKLYDRLFMIPGCAQAPGHLDLEEGDG